MEIIISSKQLDSTYFRVLFELAKEEGIESLQKLLNDLQKIEETNLGAQAIFTGKHSTLSLINKNRAVVAYLRDHKNELMGVNLLHSNITDTVASLASNPDLLDAYLKNARILENYRIGNIEIYREKSSLYNLDISAQIFRDRIDKRKITDIIKYYTDGKFTYGPLIPPRGIFGCEEVYTELIREVPTTWILRSENHEDGRQYRYMWLNSFDFAADKLPTEEELQSYDLPASLKLHLDK